MTTQSSGQAADGAKPRSTGPARQGRHWELFVDWCVATGRSSLPAAPATVTAFLAELPAGPTTVARRLRAIDTAHRKAGLVAPGDAYELDEALGRHPASSRFDASVVARALEVITVGGWPAGIVGRRDAAVVALVCSAGLTRAQVQDLRTMAAPELPLGSIPAQQVEGSGRTAASAGDGGDPLGLLRRMAKTEAPGSCPACALSRWLHVAAHLEQHGWRSVRAELADYGEIPAAEERTHDCAQPFAWPTTRGGGSPLFVGIDRHGAPENGYALSSRSITAIVAGRLSGGADTRQADRWGAKVDEGVTAARVGERRPWGPEERRRAAARFVEVEATLDDIESGAEAILARVHAAMGDGLPIQQKH